LKSIKFPFICNRLSCKWLPLFSCWLITYSDDSYSFIYHLQFPIRKVDIFNPQNSEILYDWLAIVVCQSQSIVMFFKSSKCLKKNASDHSDPNKEKQPNSNQKSHLTHLWLFYHARWHYSKYMNTIQTLLYL
jgi:hypothetical protein